MNKRVFLALLVMIIAVFTLYQMKSFAQGNSAVTPKKRESKTDITDPENIRRLELALTRLRGLEFKEDLKVGVKRKEEVREKMEEEAKKEITEEYEKVRKSLVKLGFIPEDLNLRQFMIDLYTEQIGGFYDPEAKELYLVTNMENPSLDILETLGISWDTLATLHEMTHALQDQNFDLLTLPMNEMQNDDEATAVKSLVEGEATFVMYDYMLRQRGLDLVLFPDMSDQLENVGPLSGKSLIDQAPIYIKEGLMFPYTKGMEFIKFVKARGGWEAVNRIYADLPASTEQILHPERYLMDRDFPMAITIPDISMLLTSTRWALMLDNVMGEFSISLLKKQFFPIYKSKRMSEGWDGDRFQVWEDQVDKHTSLIWFSTWDEEGDAREFFNAYKRLIPEKYNGNSRELSQAEPLIKEYGKLVWNLERTETITPTNTTDGTAVDKKKMQTTLISIEHRGQDVLVIEDFSQDIHDELAKTIWAKIEKVESTEVKRIKPEKKTEETNTQDPESPEPKPEEKDIDE